jgi:hypothetical protein
MTERVRIEWGVMMASCHVCLMDGENYGPSLMISADEGATSTILPEIARLPHYTILPLSDVQPYLANLGDISWSDKVEGDPLFGYEIRGKGDGFRAWIRARDRQKLDEQEKLGLYNDLLEVRDRLLG